MSAFNKAKVDSEVGREGFVGAAIRGQWDVVRLSIEKGFALNSEADAHAAAVF